jgi:glutaredoxin-like YruB-family protein
MAYVEIYTSETCPSCHDAKDFLMKNNIDFKENNISKDMEARKTLMKKRYMSVPVIIIDGEEMLGFDKERLSNMLHLI